MASCRVDWHWTVRGPLHTIGYDKRAMAPGRREVDLRPLGTRLGPRSEIMAAPRYRMLALDVDGTLLDPDGTLRPRTAEAVAQGRAGGHPAGALHGPALSACSADRRATGPGRPAGLQLGSDRQGPRRPSHALARRLRRRAGRRRPRPVPDATSSPPSSSPTGVRTTSTSSSRPIPPGGCHSTTTSLRTVEHAEIDPRWTTGHRAAAPVDCRSETTSPCSTFARSARGRRCSRSSRPPWNGSPAGSRPSCCGGRAIWGRCARSSALNAEQVDRHPPPGRVVGHRARRDLRRRRRRQRHPDDPATPAWAWPWGTPSPRSRTAADLVTGDHDEDGVAMLVDEVLLA